MTTETISVAEELELFAQAYHAMKTLDIDQSVIDDFIEDFADQFEFVPEEETPEHTEYRIYMKDAKHQWGEGPNYIFDSEKEAIDKIMSTYHGTSLRQSRNTYDSNYWGNTYEIRKETTTK